MIKMRSIMMIIFLALATVPVFSEAFGHSMFNSAESTIGGYRVQVATLPEFPEIGETSQILFRVTDVDFEEVDRFTLGARIFYNGQQIDAIPPKSYEGAHVEMDYVWQNSGNHIVRVDLYDMEGSSGILTYTFNMGTQSPFGFIFFIAITIGALTLGIVVTYVYFPEKLKFKSSS
ncbi:MAG: hypothetical protein OES14_01600 [Nitrosopumilus sp.]|jgi:hypothetical protein|nr:hypothetical protein [Nitrosopumilus sp.]MDH3824473.1 hypothetical protein [Nitrosopumilus sp.]